MNLLTQPALGDPVNTLQTTAPVSRAPGTATPRQAGTVLAVVAAATLLVLMTYTAPIAVLPDTVRTLHAGASGPGWILSGISLGLSATLLTAGSLADTYGRRRVFLAGTIGLVPASFVCAWAGSLLWFTVGRVLAGIAGAAVVASGLGLVGHATPPGPARVRATAVWGASVGAGIAVGPLFTAGLAHTLGHAAPYVAIAVLAAALGLAAARTLPESRAEVRRRPDPAGAVTLGGGVALLTAALIEGRSGWTRPTVLGLLAAAAVFLAAYAVTATRGRSPMLDPRLLRTPAFAVATLGALVTGLTVISFVSFLPTVMQTLLGMSAIESASLVGMWSALSCVASLAAGRLTTGVRASHQLALGLAVAVGGFAGLLGLDASWSWERLVPGLVVSGIGSGILNAALGRMAVSSVPADRAAMGSGANNTARYIGSSLGGALTIAVVRSGSTLSAGLDRAAVIAIALGAAGAVVALLVGRRAKQ